jgi:hypothetical protein
MIYKVFDINTSLYINSKTLEQALIARQDVINKYLEKMTPFFSIIEETDVDIEGKIHTSHNNVDLSAYPIVYKK